ncbi:rab GTPase activator [Paraphaeosphaeria sporulosa]|uniref:Rab GDP dissociation inhibitor n=1 Tax=Paraphaeosphaeria sporulosa TaxID=1460663 RepID=A0A177CAP3_9PLEO|nr:rab GTPase activator [Paraphaeosphaeria sporulosa]OAG04221.1 rab GTPase activator [Paraphaeosphaeria sporulosa]
MDEIAPEYDVLVLGTGLTECVLSGVLSVQGKKVLHIDRNDHYGGEAASLNLDAMYKKYGVTPDKQAQEALSKTRPNDWNIDLVPKLLMANGELTNILISTDVTKYLEFKQIGGSFVQQGKGPKPRVEKVPSNKQEALSSALMGIFEKRRAQKFFGWAVEEYKPDDPATHNGFDISNATMKEVYTKFGLEATTQDFIGHAMALYTTDDYVNAKGRVHETLERIKLYSLSMLRYGAGKSPYIYPLYGLGELPQGFARLSAIYGGTYMLNTDVDEFIEEGGKVVGIKATMKHDDGPGMKFETKAKRILADPSYFPGKVRVTGHLIKAIHILREPAQDTDEAKEFLPFRKNADSMQLIIPQSQVGRKNDIYVAILGAAQNVTPKGFYIAIVSTIAENDANPHEEVAAGKQVLGKGIEPLVTFMSPSIPLYEPIESGEKDNVFISKSYDATSHFETTTDDIKNIYRRVEGKALVVDGLREGTFNLEQ